MGPGVQFNGAAPGPPSFFNPLFDEAREPPSESVGKESKRLRFQTFAQSEYAEFDETHSFLHSPSLGTPRNAAGAGRAGCGARHRAAHRFPQRGLEKIAESGRGPSAVAS